MDASSRDGYHNYHYEYDKLEKNLDYLYSDDVRLSLPGRNLWSTTRAIYCLRFIKLVSYLFFGSCCINAFIHVLTRPSSIENTHMIPQNADNPNLADVQLSIFPRKIWQTSKYPSMAMASRDNQVAHSWLLLNPTYCYEVLTSRSSESYVAAHFSHRPELLELFSAISDPIFRADLVRYMVLFAEGGVYCDLDTRCLQPIDFWIQGWTPGDEDINPPLEAENEDTPDKRTEHDINIVVGIEYDRLDYSFRFGGFTSDLQFATWTIMAKPGHEVMDRTISGVVTRLEALAARQNTSLANIQPTYLDVIDTTGPAAFTQSVLEYIGNQTGSEFGFANLTGLEDGYRVADVLILPIQAFGAGQVHSNSGAVDGEGALVQHLFRGTWKEDHGFKHEG